MSKFTKSAIAAVALAASFAAQATEVTLSELTVIPGSHYIGYTIDGGMSYDQAIAGEVQAKTTDGWSFAAYCIQINNDLGAAPSTYAITESTKANIAKLFAVAGFQGGSFATDAVDTAVEQSALQLAVWEAFYDGALTGTFDTGLFMAVNADSWSPELSAFSASAFAQASAYLTAAANYTGSYNPSVLELTSTLDPARQTLVTSIPEPSTYALMAACLGVIGFVARRKQNT